MREGDGFLRDGIVAADKESPASRRFEARVVRGIFRESIVGRNMGICLRHLLLERFKERREDRNVMGRWWARIVFCDDKRVNWDRSWVQKMGGLVVRYGRLIAAGEGELANSNIQLTRCLYVLTFYALEEWRKRPWKRQVSTAYLVRHKHWVIFPLSAWYEATGRKRPHSPARDESVRNNNVCEPASKGVGTPVLWLVRYLTGCAEKWRKKEQQELEAEQESDGEETTKKSQRGVYSIPGHLLILIVP